MHAATSKVENLAQGLSCKLQFIHGYNHSNEFGHTVVVLRSDLDVQKSHLW